MPLATGLRGAISPCNQFMEETVSRLRAISVLFLLLAAGALTTACETARSGDSGDDFRFVDSRRDP